MSSKDSKYTIGIDMGTTNCSVAVVENGKVKVLEDEFGNRRFPSYVAFTDHECLVGFPAKSQASVNPSNTIYGFKRLLGRKFDDPVVTLNRNYLPFSVINENGKPKIEVRYKKALTCFFPEEISAMLLSKMKEIAVAHFKTIVSQAVISVPANFNYLQRMATLNAASIAGLKVSQLINEPTAAALAYCTENKYSCMQNLLVFALGGGSFDVSIVSIKNGILQVKAVSGNTDLGGEDFDHNLLSHMHKGFQQNETTDISKRKFFTELKNACAEAKFDLSNSPETRIKVEGCEYSLTVNRENFTKYNAKLYSDMMGHVNKVLQYAKSRKILHHTDTAEILSVGGSTRMPQVEVLLKSAFSVVWISEGINRDEAVTCGAAVQAALLHGDTIDSAIHLVKDIKPRSLCITPKDNTLRICIPEYSKIPSEGLLLTFQAKPEKNHVQICSIWEKSQKDILESFHTTIDDTNMTPQGNVDVSVRLIINDSGILTLESQNAAIAIMCAKNFKKEDIDIMQQRAKNIKRDCKKHRELMQCRNNMDVCFARFESEIQTLCKNSSEVIKLMNECDKSLELMRNNEGATKEEYESWENTLEELKRKVLRRFNSDP